jgi:YVTN family beta-propeller protein
VADDPHQVLVYHIPTAGPSLLTAVNVGHGGSDGGGGIAANPITHHVFVTNAADDSVTVIDGVTTLVLAGVHVGDNPMGVAVDPGLGYVFIGNRASNNVAAVPDDF